MSDTSASSKKRANPNGEADPAPKRSRNGCNTCRSRKVKCDELRDICSNCKKLDLACTWNSGSKASPRRKVGGYPSEVDQLVNLYFTHLNPFGSDAFMHRGSFLREMREGTVSSILVKAVCAAAGRFAQTGDPSHLDGGQQPERWCQEVKSALMSDTDRVGIDKLMATLIITQHEFASGRKASAWIMTSLCIRFALALGLNHDTCGLPSWETDRNNRLMWAACMLDCVCSGALPEYTACSPHNLEIRLPVSEYCFNMKIPIVGDRLTTYEVLSGQRSDARLDGIMGRYCRVMAIRIEALRYVKQLPTAEPPWLSDSAFHSFVSRLRHWQATLPDELAFSIDNLYSRQGSDEFGPLLLLHMWHDQAYCTLYRLALPGLDESAPSDYLANAPDGWVEKLRRATYVRACALRQKFGLIKHRFPDYVPTHWHFAWLAVEATRNILRYLAVAYPDGVPEEERATSQSGFEEMMHVIVSMTRYMSSVRVKARDISRLLGRQGFVVPTGLEESMHTSGARTPARGSILRNLPMLRRYLRHPHPDGAPQGHAVESQENPDPVSESLPPYPSENRLASAPPENEWQPSNASTDTPFEFNYDLEEELGLSPNALYGRPYQTLASHSEMDASWGIFDAQGFTPGGAFMTDTHWQDDLDARIFEGLP